MQEQTKFFYTKTKCLICICFIVLSLVLTVFGNFFYATSFYSGDITYSEVISALTVLSSNPKLENVSESISLSLSEQLEGTSKIEMNSDIILNGSTVVYIDGNVENIENISSIQNIVIDGIGIPMIKSENFILGIASYIAAPLLPLLNFVLLIVFLIVWIVLKKMGNTERETIPKLIYMLFEGISLVMMTAALLSILNTQRYKYVGWNFNLKLQIAAYVACIFLLFLVSLFQKLDRDQRKNRRIVRIVSIIGIIGFFVTLICCGDSGMLRYLSEQRNMMKNATVIIASIVEIFAFVCIAIGVQRLSASFAEIKAVKREIPFACIGAVLLIAVALLIYLTAEKTNVFDTYTIFSLAGAALLAISELTVQLACGKKQEYADIEEEQLLNDL